MGRVGFWQLLLDDRISWWERNAINGAYDAAEIAAGHAQANQWSIGQLQQRTTQMAREIVMLRAALTVLVNTLRDTNVLDAKLLDARLEAALEEAFPPPTENTQTAPTAQLGPLTCIRCRESKPAAQTVMSADGPICDPCSARL
jgi:hypothetical protein